MHQTDIARWGDPTRIGMRGVSGHHGELVQGLFPDENGNLAAALLTLPFPEMRSKAFYTPCRGSGLEIHSTANRRLDKSKRAAEVTLRYLGLDGWGGSVELRTTIPRSRGLALPPQMFLRSLGRLQTRYR